MDLVKAGGMLTEEQLTEYDTKYPGCIRAMGQTPTGEPWEVIVRPPTRPELKRYRKRLRDPNWAAEAVEELITDAVVYPDRPGFQSMLDRQGLLCEGISAIPAVAEMLGLTAMNASK